MSNKDVRSSVKKMSKIYYLPQNYWVGNSAIDKLAEEAKVSHKIAQEWLFKQAIWQIYLPSPRYIPRPTASGEKELNPNETHQADLLFLPHDKIGNKTYKYALTVVDVASRYKEARPLSTKYSLEVSEAFEDIYRNSSLSWPKLLQVDAGKEFAGNVSKLMKIHNVKIGVGEPGNHRAQGVVERFNKTLAEKLFPPQYAQEMVGEKRSTEWVKNLPEIIKNLNNTETRLIGTSPTAPTDAISESDIKQKPASPPSSDRPVGLKEILIDSGSKVRYLYRHGEQEGGERRRATDPIWSVDIYNVHYSITKPEQPILYYLVGVRRSFVREELLVVPYDTESPPEFVI